MKRLEGVLFTSGLGFVSYESFEQNFPAVSLTSQYLHGTFIFMQERERPGKIHE